MSQNISSFDAFHAGSDVAQQPAHKVLQHRACLSCQGGEGLDHQHVSAALQVRNGARLTWRQGESSP